MRCAVHVTANGEYPVQLMQCALHCMMWLQYNVWQQQQWRLHKSRPLAVETNTQGLTFSQTSPPIDNLADNDDDIQEDNNGADD